MSAAHRLKKRRDYLRVQRGGHKSHLRQFLVFVRPQKDPAAATRVGITVTKKVCGAVGRNAIKRRVREAFRHRRAQFPDGLDVVFVAKGNAAGISSAQVGDQMDQLLRTLARPRDARPAGTEGANG